MVCVSLDAESTNNRYQLHCGIETGINNPINRAHNIKNEQFGTPLRMNPR